MRKSRHPKLAIWIFAGPYKRALRCASALALIFMLAGCAGVVGASNSQSLPDPTPQPPVAQLSLTPASGTAPLAVIASTAGSSDPNSGGTISSTTIDLGNGTRINTASAASDGPVMRSGVGTPADTLGHNGDLYHRTDIPSIYGPKANGSWPATYSVIIGKGCTTAYHIDKDCDGYGIGPTDPTPGFVTDPNPLFGPDADDNDATVNTPASVLAKYGTVAAFLTHLGYPTNRIYYIDPTNGTDNNRRSCSAVHPCQTFGAVSGVLHDQNGGTVLYRASTSTGIKFGTGPQYNPSASSPASPVVIMAYPGESVIFQAADTPIPAASGSGGNVKNAIYDGFVLRASTYGRGHALSGDRAYAITLKNCEISGWAIAWEIGGGAVGAVIEGNVFHDINEHAMYPTSNSLWSSGPFDCTSWTWNPAYPAYNPFSNMIVRNNLIYATGQSGWDAIHINATVCGLTVSGNIVYNSGGAALTLQTGVQNASIYNNLFFSNSSEAILLNEYGCENNGNVEQVSQVGTTCDQATYAVPGFGTDINNISIVNNTLWTGRDQPPTYPCTQTGSNGCKTPYYPIYAFVGAEGVPGGRWIKNLIIENNILLTYNSAPSSTSPYPNLEFERNSYPDTYTIKNNLLYNIYPGNTQSRTMNIETDGPYGNCAAAPWWCAGNTTGTYGSEGSQAADAGDYTWTQFQSWNTAHNGGNVWGDPLFIDVQLGYDATPNLFNFHLRSGSPAIDKGLSTAAPSTDIQGKLRANPPSIGAYE